MLAAHRTGIKALSVVAFASAIAAGDKDFLPVLDFGRHPVRKSDSSFSYGK
jgi:hypothetical protein